MQITLIIVAHFGGSLNFSVCANHSQTGIKVQINCKCTEGQFGFGLRD